MSAKFKRHYEARLESIADDVKAWFVVYVYGVQSWREVWQCDSKEEAERLAAQRNAWMHAAKPKGLRHFDLAPRPNQTREGRRNEMNIPKLEPCPHCGSRDLAIEVSSVERIRPGLPSGRWYTANVHCVTCHCSTGDITMSKKQDAINTAAFRWNSRAKGGAK